MWRSLLGFVVCPRCRERFTLDVFREDAHGATSAQEREVLEGGLRCAPCRAAFPIVAGVPRLLTPALLGTVRVRHPRFFADHPEFMTTEAGSDEPLADTIESFTRQRLDLALPGVELADQWRANLARNLGTASTLEDLRGRRILDVGCGFGRHMRVASDYGAEVIGVDLSGGVDVAYRNTAGRPGCHVIQANIFDQPLRQGCFDIVWSFGVLHHMPDPAAGFRAIVDFARPEGGIVAIWVYGYRGMAFTYRLSHMRTLHALTRRLSGRGRLRASQLVTGALSALYWEPLRLLGGLGLERYVRRLPLGDYIGHDWRARVAGVHDRLSTPITHFHDHDELVGWLRDAQLTAVRVEDTARRGWRAFGRRAQQHDAGKESRPVANGFADHDDRSVVVH